MPRPMDSRDDRRQALHTWRARRGAVAATREQLQQRLNAQQGVHEALRVESAHVRATARRLTASCSVLRDEVRSARRPIPARAEAAPPETR